MRNFQVLEPCEVTWCRAVFITISESFREIKRRSGSPLEGCFLCNYKFINEDKVGIAHFRNYGNELICQNCVFEMIGNKKYEHFSRP